MEKYKECGGEDFQTERVIESPDIEDFTNLHLSWKELFGKDVEDTYEIWKKWVDSAKKIGGDAWDQAQAWLDISGCVGCVHINNDNYSWCNQIELPCAVNPFWAERGIPDVDCFRVNFKPEDDWRENEETFKQLADWTEE